MIRMSSAEALQPSITDMQDDEFLSHILMQGFKMFPKPSKPTDPEFYFDKRFVIYAFNFKNLYNYIFSLIFDTFLGEMIPHISLQIAEASN